VGFVTLLGRSSVVSLDYHLLLLLIRLTTHSAKLGLYGCRRTLVACLGLEWHWQVQPGRLQSACLVS